MSISTTTTARTAKRHRGMSALASVANRRANIVHPVNLDALIKIHLLDDSMKVLQLTENCIIQDILNDLKFKLDLNDISSFALFRCVDGAPERKLDLQESVKEYITKPDKQSNVSLLFKSWITDNNGVFYSEVFQDSQYLKESSSSLWLAYLEAHHYVLHSNKYHLTDEEAILLGCYKLQIDCGDYNPAPHTLDFFKTRVSVHFPDPVRSKMKELLSVKTSTFSSKSSNSKTAVDDLIAKIQLSYERLQGLSKTQAQISFIRLLAMNSPYFGSTNFAGQRVHISDCTTDEQSRHVYPTPVVVMDVTVCSQCIMLTPRAEEAQSQQKGSSKSNGNDEHMGEKNKHFYSNIVSYSLSEDQSTLEYFVLKPTVRVSDVESAYETAVEQLQEQSEQDRDTERETVIRTLQTITVAFNYRDYCDCVTITSDDAAEIHHLVLSYSELRLGVTPCLLGATEELQSPKHNSEPLCEHPLRKYVDLTRELTSPLPVVIGVVLSAEAEQEVVSAGVHVVVDTEDKLVAELKVKMSEKVKKKEAVAREARSSSDSRNDSSNDGSSSGSSSSGSESPQSSTQQNPEEEAVLSLSSSGLEGKHAEKWTEGKESVHSPESQEQPDLLENSSDPVKEVAVPTSTVVDAKSKHKASNPPEPPVSQSTPVKSECLLEEPTETPQSPEVAVASAKQRQNRVVSLIQAMNKSKLNGEASSPVDSGVGAPNRPAPTPAMGSVVGLSTNATRTLSGPPTIPSTTVSGIRKPLNGSSSCVDGDVSHTTPMKQAIHTIPGIPTGPTQSVRDSAQELESSPHKAVQRRASTTIKAAIRKAHARKSVLVVEINPLENGATAANTAVTVQVENLSDAVPIGSDVLSELLLQLMATESNEERLSTLSTAKIPYLFTSNDLAKLVDVTTSVKTRIAIITMLGPRIIDPRSKSEYFLDLFRFAEDKAFVEDVLKQRAQVLTSEQFNVTKGGVNRLSMSTGRGGGGGGNVLAGRGSGGRAGSLAVGGRGRGLADGGGGRGGNATHTSSYNGSAEDGTQQQPITKGILKQPMFQSECEMTV